jgi:hypothetical protein
MHHYDELPAFPPWLTRRLRQLADDFARQPRSEPSVAAYRHYSGLSGGNGRELTDQHLALLGRAWLVAGPHVSAPSWRYVACTIGFLEILSREDVLLQAWLTTWAGDHLRVRGWQERNPFWPITDALHSRLCRRYWAWLVRMVREETRHTAGDWQEEVIAARVVGALYAQSGLSGFMQRMGAWATARYIPEQININADPAWTGVAPTLDRFSRRSARHDVRFIQLATQADFEREAKIMCNCVANRLRYSQGRLRLYFAVHGPASLRATAELGVDEAGRWRVLDLRDRRNRPIGATRLQGRLTQEFCEELTAIGDDDPLLSEYVRAREDSEARWRQHGDATRPRMACFIPGIGKQTPSVVFERLWHACGG